MDVTLLLTVPVDGLGRLRDGVAGLTAGGALVETADDASAGSDPIRGPDPS